MDLQEVGFGRRSCPAMWLDQIRDQSSLLIGVGETFSAVERPGLQPDHTQHPLLMR